ncbi:MAG: Fic family protein, partial [Candidatus Bathyarchaeota archaeon]|nr:Fic family protein [Candidatus Bathyarchaeota archaeon]
MQFRSLLDELGFPMSKNARKLPKGAIRKLESETNKKTSIPIQLTVQPSPEALEPTPRATLDALDWKTVGRVREVRLLSLEEVLKIHFTLVSDFADQEDPIYPPGPRDDDIIASAVFRQHTSIGKHSKYPSIEMSAAALIHSLVLDHPFHNGNKRTA